MHDSQGSAIGVRRWVSVCSRYIQMRVTSVYRCTDKHTPDVFFAQFHVCMPNLLTVIQTVSSWAWSSSTGSSRYVCIHICSVSYLTAVLCDISVSPSTRYEEKCRPYVWVRCFAAWASVQPKYFERPAVRSFPLSLASLRQGCVEFQLFSGCLWSMVHVGRLHRHFLCIAKFVGDRTCFSVRVPCWCGVTTSPVGPLADSCLKENVRSCVFKGEEKPFV